MYTDAKARAGKAKPYYCPHCRDGFDLAKLYSFLAAEWGESRAERPDFAQGLAAVMKEMERIKQIPCEVEEE